MNEKIITEEIEIPQLKRKRKIRIYLPLNYNETNKKYPVLYMQDGQNLFNTKTSAFGKGWGINKTLNNLEKREDFEGIIVVGIDNNEILKYGIGRLNEYSPWENSEIGNNKNWLGKNQILGGEGAEYAKFIVETLKPKIDKEYRTLSDRDNTAISGSSMGGIISLYTGLKYQNVFSKIAGLSNAFWFAEKEMLEFIEKNGKKNDMKIYLDVGTKETSKVENLDFPAIYINSNKSIVKKVKEYFEDVKFVIEEGSEHNEIYWAKRFPEVIKYLFELK